MGEAAGRAAPWQERVRAGLVALLGFFDDEPQSAGLLIAEARFAGAPTLKRRARLFAVVGDLLNDQGRDGIAACGGAPSPRVISELVVGGVFSVIRARMLDADGGRFVELAPSLILFIAASYLGEQAAGAELVGKPVPEDEARSAGVGLPIRATYRTSRVLRAITASPRASNREIAKAAGLSDEGQTSKLLSRLKRRGLIENVGLGAAYGERNSWLLTPSGRRLATLSGYSLPASASVGAEGSTRRRGDA